MARSKGLLLALGLGAWLASAPAEAASVKSIQTGEVSMSSSPATVNSASPQPFNGVTDLTKAFVVCASRTMTANPADRVSCDLSASAITVTAGAANANTVVRWYVVEFEGGVVVQRGVRTFSTAGGGVPSDTTLNVTLNPAVDLSKSFVLITERMNSTLTDVDESWTVRAQLTAATNLELTRNELSAATTVAWQVVQMEGASVQRGLTTLQSSTGSTTAGWSIAGATMTNSFLVFSRRGATQTAGLESRYLVTGEITNLSTLTFTRGATDTQANKAVEIAWEVVTLTDGGATNRGGALMGATTLALDQTLSPAVDTARTIPFIWSRVFFGGDANLGSASFTATITAGNTLRVERAITNGLGHNFAWQTVQFFKCAAVPEVGYVAATAQNGQVTVYWSSPDPVLILRDGASIPDRPENGKAYAIDEQVGSARVKYNGAAAASWTDTSVTAGATYFYKVFPKSGTGGSSCYAPGTDSLVDTKMPAAAPPTWSWSYTLAGGSMLKPGIAGWDGTVSPSSNASRLISLNTTTGAQSWTVGTTAGVQGWLSWIPISGGTDNAVIGADQGGTVYSINPATGATNWTQPLAASGAEAIQAAVAAQLRAYSNTQFQTNPGYTADVLFVATLNSTTTVPCGTAGTNNKLFALNASTGAVLWAFNSTVPSPCAYAVNYVSGMPYVDYGRNRIYVTSHSDNATKTQSSLWIIDTLTGALIGRLALGHLDSSPTLSYDGNTIYVGNTDGMLYAVNANAAIWDVANAVKWSFDLGAGAALKGFVWEDWANPGRLYFSTANGWVWCVQDLGASAAECGAPWSKPSVPGPSTPLLLGALYVGSGTPDFKLYQINLATGAIEKSLALDGTTVGDVSTEWNPATGDYNWVFVGTGAGKLYRIEVPLP
jgi:outer membrane protein assembly factor BamB